MAVPKVVLVLGGGGVKGMAHVGAWRALSQLGVPVAEIVGTSIGALVGACIGGGASPEVLTEQSRRLGKQDIVVLNRWALLLNGIRQESLFRGDTLRAYIESVLPTREFGSMRLPVSMNAVDLERGEVVWFGAGGRDVDVADAVYASCALPVFYPPAALGGRYYVDGGIRDALPLERAASRGAEVIVAVDTGAGPVRDPADTVAAGMMAIHHRAMEIMGYARKRELLDGWRGPDLIYIRPALDVYSTFDFGHTDYFLSAGYEATMTALSSRPDLTTPPGRAQRAG